MLNTTFPSLAFIFRSLRTNRTNNINVGCLVKTSYTRKMNDLAQSSIRTFPIRFLPYLIAPALIRFWMTKDALTRWYAAATDIEDRKQAEQQLQSRTLCYAKKSISIDVLIASEYP